VAYCNNYFSIKRGLVKKYRNYILFLHTLTVLVVFAYCTFSSTLFFLLSLSYTSFLILLKK
jgi:hypothetical protein